MIRTRLISMIIAVVPAAGCSTPMVTPPPASARVTTGSSLAPSDEDGVGVAPSVPAAPAAVAAALAFMTAWARPDLDRDTWYSGVRDLIIPRYARLLAD